MKDRKYYTLLLAMILCMVFLFFINHLSDETEVIVEPETEETAAESNISEETDPFEEFIGNLPDYNGTDYSIEVNNGIPFFTEEEINNWYENAEDSFLLSDLDEFGRAGVAVAKITPDSLCFEKRTESIANLKPSGWHTVRYDDLIEDKYLFNRCHLIMRASYQSLTNTDVIENLVTGTRYMNLNELETEEMVTEYVKVSGHSLLYRATPVYVGDELVPRGILLEGYGHGSAKRIFQFCVYYFNVQPGIEIDYNTGKSRRCG